MNLSLCTKHFLDLGLEVRGRIAYGIYSDYPLILQFQGNGNTVASILIRIQLQQTLVKKQRKELKLLLKKRAQIIVTGQTLQLTIRTPKEEALLVCNYVLDHATEYLRTLNYTAPEICPICGNGSCDSAVYYNGAFQKVHANCITAAMDHLTQKANKNQLNGSYPLGILGALLGGLVGILPNLLTIWFTETIYVLLYALIPICIYWGYRLFRGVINKSAIIITIVLSVLYLFIMEFVLLVISVYIETNGLLLIKECFEAFIDPVVFREIFSDMITSFVFLALGILYSWRMISETNTNIHSNAEFTLSTLIPLHRPMSMASEPETETAKASADTSDLS